MFGDGYPDVHFERDVEQWDAVRRSPDLHGSGRNGEMFVQRRSGLHVELSNVFWNDSLGLVRDGRKWMLLPGVFDGL